MSDEKLLAPRGVLYLVPPEDTQPNHPYENTLLWIHKNTILKESSLKQWFHSIRSIVGDNFRRVVQGKRPTKESREGRRPRRESLQPSERRELLLQPRLPRRCPDQSPEDKILILGSNLFETYPAFSLVVVRVSLTIWVNFSQQGIRLEKRIWKVFLYCEKKKIEHLFCNQSLQSVSLNDHLISVKSKCFDKSTTSMNISQRMKMTRSIGMSTEGGKYLNKTIPKKRWMTNSI